MVRTQAFTASVFIALIALVIGCDSSTSTNRPGGLELTKVKPGTVFTFQQSSVDSAKQIVIGTPFLVIDSVGDVDLGYFGKEHVMQIITSGARDSFVVVHYFNYESNGDFSELVDLSTGFGQKTMWITYPISSKQQQKFVVIDTVFGGIVDEHFARTITTSCVGPTEIPYKDSKLAVIHTQIVDETHITAGDSTTTYSFVTEHYFAPSLGYIGERHDKPIRWQNDKVSGYGTDKILIDYRKP